MNASRILPTVAFSVAVSFFFIPPVVAVVQKAPGPKQATSNLVVKREAIAVAPAANRPMPGTCTPSEKAASSGGEATRSPWKSWVVASLADH